MRFRLAGIPVTIQPLILFTAFAIGPRRDPMQMMIWMPLVLAGVLVHELGHALLVRRFGQSPWIELHAFGGTTGWRSVRPLTAGQRIAVSAAGPAVGIMLGAGLWAALIALAPPIGSTAAIALHYAVFVTFGWGVLNLAPVLPLDGGHIVTTAAEAVGGRRGRTAMLWISIGLTLALVAWAILAGDWWLAILGGVLTWTNVQVLRGPSSTATAPPTSEL